MFTTLVLALALPAASAADEVALKWSLKAGDVFYARNVTVIDMTMGFLGQKIDQKQEITAITRYRVKSADDSGLVMELTYLDMNIKNSTGADTSAVTDAIKGATLTATLDNKFRVTKIEGQKKLVERLAGEDANAKAMLSAMISEDAVRQMFSTLFALTPAAPVKVGGTWEKEDTLDAGGIGKITSKTKFKLRGVEGDLAAIDTTADMTFKAGDGEGLPFKIKNADFKIEKFTGTNQFDLKAGRLRESKTEMTMSGSMTIVANGQEVDATLTQKVKSTVVITDKNPVKN